eukprot:Blabericola_migrator_1__3736@NODE_211_length_11365_cov_144_425828_g181_i0_p4_GENE_NODE_211_length_11365_cov_144_425828_g181_i0NODE_211_length_11365_cov_144_425828_g181_i0_p4_ORF_typecomplete_len292_score36_04Peptidase_C97/PF05903_14/3_9e29LRAT/PF04970_13/0_25_NODE_211_length_11365_cov_144_425828_g181_i053146189
MTPRQNPVSLRIYDLSDGHAAALSQILIGKKFRGVWHCGILVFGFEYFYGGYIGKLPPHQVELEIQLSPYRVEHLGYTGLTQGEFDRFLKDIDDRFTPETYDLVEWNCNHFADVCARFLLNGKGIPTPILQQPQKAQDSWRGKIVMRVLSNLTGNNPFVDREVYLGTRHPNNADNRPHQSVQTCSKAEDESPWVNMLMTLYSNVVTIFDREQHEDTVRIQRRSQSRSRSLAVPQRRLPTSTSLSSPRSLSPMNRSQFGSQPPPWAAGVFRDNAQRLSLSDGGVVRTRFPWM